MQIQFPRNARGEYDPVHGTYRDKKVQLQVKFANQVRLCLGVALRDNNGEEEACRLLPGVYSSKNVVTVKTRKEEIEAEIRRLKTLKRDDKRWVTSHRVPNALYLNDKTTQIDGIKESKGEALADQGIVIVADILDIVDDSATVN